MRRSRIRAAALLVGALGLASVSSAGDLGGSANSNVWVLEPDGSLSASWMLGPPGDWSQACVEVLGFRAAEMEGGGFPIQVPDQTSTSPQSVLVNRVAASCPAPVAIPEVSLKGVTDAVTTDPLLPSVTVTPEPGVYDRAIRVTIKGYPPTSAPAEIVTVSWSNPDTGQSGNGTGEVSFFLATGPPATIQYSAITGSGSVNGSAIFDVNGPVTSDGDFDGVPDIWEVENGFDPNTPDLFVDSDGDGISDFDEVIRGSDPNDGTDAPDDDDGDGAFDFDEQAHVTAWQADATNPNVPHPDDAGFVISDRPNTGRLTEVEWRVNGGSAWQDVAHTTKQTNLQDLTGIDVLWEAHFDQDFLPDPADLLGIGHTESQLPVYWQRTLIESTLAAGDIPFLRLPAGEPLVVRVRHGDGAGTPDAWAVKVLLPARKDVLPEDMQPWLDAGSHSYATAQEWEDLYKLYFADRIVQDLTLDLDSRTHLGVALLESAIEWFDPLEGEGFVVLGEKLSPAAVSAVETLQQANEEIVDDTVLPTAIVEPGRSLDDLIADYEQLAQPGQLLDAFVASVDGIYAAPGAITQATTTRATASLVQGDPADDDVLARYVARLLATLSLAEIQTLPPAEEAELLDPFGDSDGDGLDNAEELGSGPDEATDPLRVDTDQDGYGDPGDPCPADATNACLRVDYQEMDSDGDGFVDSIDNCMNDANVDQVDSNADGIGDACVRIANIRTPSSNLRVYVGEEVDFSSIDTELCLGYDCSLIQYAWDFDGAAAASSDADPGPVEFDSLGSYQVSLTATHPSLGAYPADTRWIVVQGVADQPSVDVGGPYSAVEGQSILLTALANSPGGTITGYEWDFGDSTQGVGNPVPHDWPSQGVYDVEVTATDSLLLKGTDATTVSVADSVPQVVIQAMPAGPPSQLTWEFEDLSTAYDGITARAWTFGDGSNSEFAQSLSHTFPGPGVYDVTLLVFDGDGSYAIGATEIAVDMPSVPAVGVGGLGVLIGTLAVLGAALAGSRARFGRRISRPAALRRTDRGSA